MFLFTEQDKVNARSMLGVISDWTPRLYQNYGYTLGNPHQMFFRELELVYHNLSSSYTY